MSLVEELHLVMFASDIRIEWHQGTHRVFPEQPNMLVVMGHETMGFIARRVRIVGHVVPSASVQHKLFGFARLLPCRFKDQILNRN